LPISRRLAEMLEGTLEVESEVGVGSTFRLILPASSEAPSSTRTTKASELDAVRTETDAPSGKARDGASSRASR
jgi:hypothetical protein